MSQFRNTLETKRLKVQRTLWHTLSPHSRRYIPIPSVREQCSTCFRNHATFILKTMAPSFLSRLSVLLLITGLLVPGVLAQDTQSVDPSESEISEVATLMVKVEKVREKFAPRIDKADDAEENKELQLKQEDKIEKAVASSDKISPDRYHQIVQAARSDKELQKAIMKKVKKERKRLK